MASAHDGLPRHESRWWRALLEQDPDWNHGCVDADKIAVAEPVYDDTLERMRELLKSAMEICLTPKEAECLVRHELLDQTHEEIGKAVHCTRERVRQIITKAIRKVQDRIVHIHAVRGTELPECELRSRLERQRAQEIAYREQRDREERMWRPIQAFRDRIHEVYGRALDHAYNLRRDVFKRYWGIYRQWCSPYDHSTPLPPWVSSSISGSEEHLRSLGCSINREATPLQRFNPTPTGYGLSWMAASWRAFSWAPNEWHTGQWIDGIGAVAVYEVGPQELESLVADIRSVPEPEEETNG